MDWAPNQSYQGDCNAATKYLEVGYGGFSTGLNIADCFWNDFGKNSNVPGEARIQIKQPFGQRSGTLTTGYVTAFAVAQGSTPSFNDQQQIIFDHSGALSKVCDATNSGKVCPPPY